MVLLPIPAWNDSFCRHFFGFSLCAAFCVCFSLWGGNPQSASAQTEPEGKIPAEISAESSFHAHAPLRVWYIPGFLSGGQNQNFVLEKLRTVLPPGTQLEAIDWNDLPESYLKIAQNWDESLTKTDSIAEELFSRIQKMSPKERQKLVLIGHSLGGNISVKTLAKCGENGIQIRRMILLGAAIENDAPEIETAIHASLKKNYSFVNMNDAALETFRANEGKAALGTGYAYSADLRNFQEIAVCRGMNHSSEVYLDALTECLSSQRFVSPEVIVPQDLPNQDFSVADKKIWWNVLDVCQGWELQQNTFTNHCRILNPENVRMAYGRKEEMLRSFEKVKVQLYDPEFQFANRSAESSGTDSPEKEGRYSANYAKIEEKPIIVPQEFTNTNLKTQGGKVFWKELENYSGWKLQKNYVTGHCRILDPENVRRAWGMEEGMRNSFAEVKRQLKDKEEQID